MTDRVKELVGRLEEQIVLGWLMPRERLLEDRLTEEFACKKHVVREALSELERMGLVERIPNKGAMVRLLSSGEVQRIYSVRKALETLAAQQIPLPASVDFVAELTAVQARHAEAVDAGDNRGAFRANMEFHETLFSACGNPYLAELIRNAAQKVHGARFFTAASAVHLRQARNEHWAMVNALERGDREALVDLCRNHLEPSLQAYLSAVQARSLERAGSDDPTGR